MRYLSLSKEDRIKMLNEIGCKGVDELFDSLPAEFLQKSPIKNLELHKSEQEVESVLTKMAKKNRSISDGPFFLGAGVNKHHIPASVDHLIQRSEFLTSYTPYQPEISQGTLAVIFQFQSIISLLTGMEIANASMYDGPTALAEACLMAIRIKKKKNIAVFGSVNPEYINVTKTFLDLAESKFVDSDSIADDCAALIVQYPDFNGEIQNLDEIREFCNQKDILLIVLNSEILSFGLINPPSQADIVVGEAAGLGVSPNFGGPLLGYFATKKEYVRQAPGRICGLTTDLDGKESYVLTLNAREQHIRREKATSNICSNQGLCATAFTIHVSLLGEVGFKKLALINHKKAVDLTKMLQTVKNIRIVNNSFFNEFTIELNKDANLVNKELLKENIIGGFVDPKNINQMIIAVNELTSNDDMDQLVKALNKILN